MQSGWLHAKNQSTLQKKNFNLQKIKFQFETFLSAFIISQQN